MQKDTLIRYRDTMEMCPIFRKGDYIIMMSDGVLDAVPEQERIEFLRQIIGDEPEQSPQVIAGRILNASLLVQNFEPRDDMTVLVCGVFEEK